MLIVDDEAAIRRGMKNYIPWNDMGFEVVADFEDGKETIEYIEERDVDVIITDIEMAEISGLMLAKHVYENKPSIKVVILSGYKLFEYAKTALEYKVEHYLLKPLKMDEVKEVFRRLKEELDSNVQRETPVVDESLLKEQFFLNLLVGRNKDMEDVLQYAKTVSVNLKEDSYIALLDVKITTPSEDDSYNMETSEKQKLLEDMFATANIEFEYHLVNFVKSLMKVIVIGNADDFNDIESFKNALERDTNDKCTASLRLFQMDVDAEIEKCFDGLKEFLDFQYWLELGMQKNYQTQELTMDDPEQIRKIQKEYKKILKSIHNAEFDQLKNAVDNSLFELRGVSLLTLKQMVIDIFSALSTKLIRADNSIWQHMLLIMDYQRIVDCRDLEELKNTCDYYVNDIVDNIGESQNNTSKQVIAEAMKYIREHYETDISLDLVADRFYLNSAYLSRLFKQYAGNTFTDYLIQVRMNAAIEYIETGNYKIYEISKMVGYNSEKYFYRVFKQYTGYSPAEYQRSKVLTNG